MQRTTTPLFKVINWGKIIHTGSKSYFTLGISKRVVVEYLVDRFTRKEYTGKVFRYRLQKASKKEHNKEPVLSPIR